METTFKWISKFGLFLIAVSCFLILDSFSRVFAGSLAILGFIIFVFFASKSTVYVCSECHHEFKVSPLRFLAGTNTGASKILKCPCCNKIVPCKPKRNSN